MTEVHSSNQWRQITWDNVRLLEGFAKEYQKLCLEATLPIELEQLERTGRLAALEGKWKKGDPDQPHFFWDSDIAKWIEALAYSLAIRKNTELENTADRIIDKIEKLQQEDGYFNLYYQLVEPGKRFSNLKRMHELYCLGHLIEAAVAYYHATGKEKLLNVVCRYLDLIIKTFGNEEGQIQGYDGHAEIELALFRLYEIKKEIKYLDLALFFLNQRGTWPHFFDKECEKRGEAAEDRKYRNDLQGAYSYYQAHKPLRNQRKAVGHAVRAMYIYCAMQDAANYTGDEGFEAACDSIWDDIVDRQLYITGGIGPRIVGERFSYGYELINEMSYNETCASIGLMMFGLRRLKSGKHDSSFGDAMERAFFNNIAGGVSLDGRQFYYANPLTVIPEAYQNINDPRPQLTIMRQEWFDVACCPPNLARLLSSVGGYIYTYNDRMLNVNMYLASETDLTISGKSIRISQSGDYPWDGNIKIEISTEEPAEFILALRIPEWTRNSFTIIVDSEEYLPVMDKGYCLISRCWQGKVNVDLKLDMRIRLTEARPEVYSNCGKVAVERGPIVYCFEECDNGSNLNDLRLDLNSLNCGDYNPDLLNGIIPIYGSAKRRHWKANTLYQEWNHEEKEVKVTAVPFYARYNRGAGELITWINYD